jgi:hypothetical protein
MPKYHALDTAVKLYVWDPQQPINTSNTLSNDGQALISNGQQRDVSSVPFSIFDGVPAPTKSPPADPAFGYDVDVVSEEYFEGQEGVDFLCHDMPFFLVNAGKELFEPPQLSFGHSGSISQENDALMLDQHCGNSTLSSFVSTSLENAIEAPADGAHDVDAESNLSDISSSLFTPRIESSPGPEARGTIVDDEPSKSSKARMMLAISILKLEIAGAKPQSKRELHLEEYEARKKGPRQFISKPITGPKPIKISVDLSKKSFAPSLFNNQAQEVCINIFYNGELTHSRVVRAAMKEDDKHLIFSGRRVEALLEVPWVVRPNWQSSDGYSKVTTSGFEDRWNRVNQLLFGEADEWRRYGKHRSPMGEYLEELSKKAIPESVKNLERGAGNKMGIIDVSV